MKILIDECLPEDIKKEFTGHLVSTVSDLGWNSMTNGMLLSATIKDGFEVFVTIDKNLQYQQNLKKYNLIIVVQDSHKSDLEILKLIVPKVLLNLSSLEKGEAHHFGL